MKLKLIIALLFATFLANAQIEFSKRIEIELKNDYTSEAIIEVGKNGIILSAYDTKLSKETQIWNYKLYNTDLEISKEIDVAIPLKYAEEEVYYNDDMLFTLFKHKKGKYILSQIDVATFKESRVSGKLPKKAYITDMTVLGDYAFFNMRIKHNKFLYAINWKTGKQNIIPIEINGYASKKIVFAKFQLIKETKEVFLYITAKKGKQSEMYIMRLDENGKKKNLFKLTEDIDKNIMDVSAQNIGKDKYLYTGTYSKKGTTYSQGMFFCEATNEKVRFIKYHPYTSLENFFKYLPERKQARIEKKKKRKAKNGKGLKTNYRISTHNMSELEDGYIFLGEAYYPTYRTYTTTSYVNGVAQTTVHTEFDGYQYTHAVLAKFSKDGDIIWDQIFELFPRRKPFYEKQFVSGVKNADEDKMKFVFTDHGKIKSKVFDTSGNIVTEKESIAIETEIKGDIEKWTNADLNYWYSNYFVNYGTQKIKNKTSKKGKKDKKGNKVKRKRKVYFISKIKFQ